MSGGARRPGFSDIVVGVDPLPPGPTRVPATPPAPAPLGARSDAAKVLPLIVDRDGDTVLGSKAGVNRKLLLELANGELHPQAQVDVHRMAAAQAQRTVSRFLRSARERGLATVLIIHGRGRHSGPLGPVLRDAIVERIIDRHSGDVLAFRTAAPAHGGIGATMVRLRRPH